ncbi:MAG: hypothetical protein O9301_05070 [Leptospira sp.]|nr:hypothetical protein [Leptospira sp.]
MSAQNKVIWEIRNEKNKAGVRWFIITLIIPYLSYLLYSGRSVEIGREEIFNWVYVSIVAGFIIAVNLCVTYVLLKANKDQVLHPSLKYITMVADFLAVALVMIPTGGKDSMFFVINYVVIVSNSLRYGMRVSIFGTIVMNLFYVSILYFQFYPNLEIDSIQKEILKIGGFWLVGIYTGYLSMRFEILRGEVVGYQKLLKAALEKNGT